MPDYVDKVLQMKRQLHPSPQTYDQEDQMPLLAPVDSELDLEVQHVPPTLEQNGAGFPDLTININKNICSRTNRDASSPQTRSNIGSPKLIKKKVLALKF